MITDVILLDFGLCHPINEERKENQLSPTGHFLACAELKFVEQTQTIKAKQGVTFGVKYKLVGFVNAEAEYYESRVLHPILCNPHTGHYCIVDVEEKVGDIDENGFDYFTLEYDWEVQPGNWTFQLLQSDKLLFEYTFQLI